MKFIFNLFIVASLLGCQENGNQIDDHYLAEIEDSIYSTTIDTAILKPIEIIGYGVITDREGSGPVNLYSSTLDSRVIIGEVMPNDTVAIEEKGEAYWWVSEKNKPENKGYLMMEWVKEIKK
jgi:hypothetical protein